MAQPSRADLRPVRQSLVAMVLLCVMLLGLLTAMAWLVMWLYDTGTGRPEVALPIMLVAGAGALIVALGTLAIVFRALQIHSTDQPLGLPRGSVQAIMALLLILLFFVTAVFLFNSVSSGTGTLVEGVTQEQLETYPPEQIITQTPTNDPGDPAEYNVTLRQTNPEGVDMAKQLLTTVSTLVVSIAAFYFGARSVESAASTMASSMAELDTSDTPTGTGTITPPPPAPPGSPLSPAPLTPLAPTDVADAATEWDDTGPPGDVTASSLDAEVVASLGVVEVEGIELGDVTPDHNAEHGVNEDVEMDDSRGDAPPDPGDTTSDDDPGETD